MSIINTYKHAIIEIMDQIQGEKEAITSAATIMADAIMDGKVINVVGPGGHSNIPVEEVTWRAGELVPMNGMLDAGTNLMMGGKRSNCYERLPGYAVGLFNAYELGKTPNEVIIVCNAYGINSMTIDCALEGKKRGMKVIGVTSESFCRTVPFGHQSRHPSGQNLCDIVDVFVNNHMPYGDAIIEIEGMEPKMGPTSTFANVFAIHCLTMTAAEIMVKRGYCPPVWTSANMQEGDKLNHEYELRYRTQIRHLW
ncbi:MAG TPA: sugar isomerase [Ruminococcaceae bacterium]|nr:sugar isomerase [Oscillospiraceae bacterium]